MNSIRRRGLVLAMESMEDEVEGSPEDLAEDVAEVEVSSSELKETELDASDLQDGISEAIEDSQTLDKIKDVLEDSIESGEGLDETAAEITEVAIESICMRLGIQRESRLLPATESFGSTTSRLAATRIALEAAENIFVRMWKAIKSALTSVAQAVKEFLTKYFTALGKIENLYTTLKTSVDGLDPAKKAEDADIESESLAYALGNGGNATYDSAVNVLKAQDSFTTNVLLSSSVLVDVSKELVSALNNLDSFDFNKLEDASRKYIEVLKDKKGLVDGTSIEPSTDNHEQGVLGFIVAWLIKDQTHKGTKAAVLKKNEMTGLLTSVAKLLVTSKEFKKEEAKIAQVNDLITSIADKFIKGSVKVADDGSDKDSSKKASKAAGDSVKSINKLVHNSSVTLLSMNVKALKSSLSYIEKSLKAYK
jgi:hypothetical protein